MATIYTIVSVVVCILYGRGGVHAKIIHTFEIDDWLNVSCSKNSVGSNVQWPGGLGPIITKIVLSRIPHDTGVAEELAIYNAFALPGNFEIITKTGNGWYYEMEGGQNSGNLGDLEGNSATMRLDLKINGPKCNDAAVYRCSFTYYDQDSKPVNAPLVVSENATWISPVSNLRLKKTPQDGEYQPEVVINLSVAFICTVDGPKKLSIKWESSQCSTQNSSFPIWSVANGEHIDQTQPAVLSSRCTSVDSPLWTHSSTYRFTMRATVCGVKCLVSSGDLDPRELSRSLDIVPVTVLVQTTGLDVDAEEDEKTERSPSTEGGRLAAGVIVCVLLILIGIVLNYFLWYRD